MTSIFFSNIPYLYNPYPSIFYCSTSQRKKYRSDQKICGLGPTLLLYKQAETYSKFYIPTSLAFPLDMDFFRDRLKRMEFRS
jgi:hypothetical protein